MLFTAARKPPGSSPPPPASRPAATPAAKKPRHAGPQARTPCCHRFRIQRPRPLASGRPRGLP